MITNHPDKAISRRALLASLGAAGATIAAGQFAGASLAYGSVTESVYGPNAPASGIGYVATVSIAGLRALSSAHPKPVYFVTDSGQEGHFVYDASDTTSADDGIEVIVTTDGKRYIRFAAPSQDRPEALRVVATDFDVSASGQTTTGSIAAGSAVLTVASPIDFQTGQGILVAGAGAATKEVLTLVIEAEPTASGTVSVQLPGEAAQTVNVTASPEVVEVTIASGSSVTGNIALVLDTVEFLIPVTSGETAADIAGRIRGWFLEGWTAGGSGSAVTLTSGFPGVRSDSFLYGQGTGVSASVTLTKGVRTTARGIASTLRGRTYANWTAATGYSNSNVVFFIANTTGAKGGENATYSPGTTGANGRLEVAQYGNYLLSTITAISGSAITLAHNAVSSASGVYVGHDDSTALQTVLNGAANKQVILPAGTYRLARTLTPASGTILQGEGYTATILQYQALAQHGIRIGNLVNDVQIRHLKLKNICAPDSAYGGDTERHGIIMEHALRTVIEYCWVDNADDGGIRAGGGTSGNSAGTRMLYNVVVNTSEGSGIEVIRGEDCLLLGNIVRQSSQHAVRLCGSRKTTALGNYLENNGDGFSIQGYGNGVNVTQRTQDFVIEGNVIKDQLTQAVTIFNQANSGIISGNWMENAQNRAGGIGIQLRTIVISGRLSTNFDIAIEGNMIKGFGRAIEMRGDMDRIMIRNNTVKDYTANGTGSAYAVYLDCDDVGDLRHILIEGNTFICHAANKIGVRLFRPSARTSIQAHNNTFMLRRTDMTGLKEACLKNAFTAPYNADALVRTIAGTCTIVLPDTTEVTGTTAHDTNRYIGLPV